MSDVLGVGSRESGVGARSKTKSLRHATPDTRHPGSRESGIVEKAKPNFSDPRPPTRDPRNLELARLQEWMQAVVTHPGDVYEAAEAAAIGVDSVVLPSKTLQPIQRVGIYHGMYMLRMIEALEADYEALVYMMGGHAFGHLVREYVQRFPSRSYTLNRLGDHLPEFIAGSTLKRKTFLADLARLELAMTHVFEEAEAAPMAPDAIAAVPPERIESLRFTPIPALRLLTFASNANDIFQAFREERPVEPRRVKSWLAVHRRNYGVYRMPLSQEAFTFLGFLVSGETIGSAIMKFARRFRRMPKQQDLFNWFRDWSEAGLFAAIAITEQET